MASNKIYTLRYRSSKISGFYTTQDIASRTGYNFRYVSQLCREGRFEGAYQIKGTYGKMEWYIPASYLGEIRDPDFGRGHYAHKIRTRRRISFI